MAKDPEDRDAVLVGAFCFETVVTTFVARRTYKRSVVCQMFVSHVA